jgi:hypothetical protein
MPSVSDIMNVIAPISQYAAMNEIGASGLYGGGIDNRLPRKIYIVRKNCEWLYSLDPSNETLVATTNYLYALCGEYGLYAQNVGGVGGNVAGITGVSSVLPSDIEFIVDDTSFIADGQSSKIFPDSWIGFNMLFIRGEYPQGTIDTGGSFYTWDKDTATFTCSPAATMGEHFLFKAIG